MNFQYTRRYDLKLILCTFSQMNYVSAKTILSYCSDFNKITFSSFFVLTMLAIRVQPSCSYIYIYIFFIIFHHVVLNIYSILLLSISSSQTFHIYVLN